MNSDSNINPLESTQEETLNNQNSTDAHSSNEQPQESREGQQETIENVTTPAATQDQIFENNSRQVEASTTRDVISQQTETRSLVSFAGRNLVIAEERSEGQEENNDEQEGESHQDDAMTFRTMGSQNFIHFNHLSQDRSVISNSQVSLFKNDNEGHGFWDENGFDSRQSSQMFDRSQSFRLQKGPPELLHSDSNFMFGPRYKTKAYDPTVSPMKKTARKALPDFGRDIMQSFEDSNEQRYDQEEKDRRKSMSRLSLSSNKQKKRFTRESTLEEVYESQHELGNPFINEVSFNCNNMVSSQKDDDVSEADNRTYQSSQQDIGRPRRLDSALLNDETPLQSQEMKISRMFEPVIPAGEDCETIMEPSCGAGNQQTAEVNNWSVLTEAGDYSVMTDGFMMKSTTLEKDISNGDGKVSESKKFHIYRSPLSTKAKSINGENTGKKSVRSVLSMTKLDKENIDPTKSQEVDMEIECPRIGDKLSQEKSSPASEETVKSGSDSMVEEKPLMSAEKAKAGGNSVFSSPQENNNHNGGNNNHQEPEVHAFEGEPSTSKKLSYMERKLRAIEAENYKMMGAFDFKKSYSKLEKEKMEKEQEQRTQNLFQSVRKPTSKENEDHSSFMTDTKKHYSRVQLEKMASKENIQDNSNALSARLPFQMIQSEADREAMYSQESLLHKSAIFTPANEKKRKYDAISTSDECPGSVVEGNTSLKRVKITDENHVESFEEMLAKSKKKIPRIQLEKELCKEREKVQKEQELKELQTSMKDAVFKVEIPLLFKKEENSGGDNGKSYYGKRQSNGVI